MTSEAEISRLTKRAMLEAQQWFVEREFRMVIPIEWSSNVRTGLPASNIRCRFQRGIRYEVQTLTIWRDGTIRLGTAGVASTGVGFDMQSVLAKHDAKLTLLYEMVFP